MPESSSTLLTVVATTHSPTPPPPPPTTTATAPNNNNKNFEEDNEEEESWPAVDVGNLIIDLDADIDKQQQQGMSGKSGGVKAMSSVAPVATVVTAASAAGTSASGTVSQTVTESPGSSGTGSGMLSSAASSSAALEKGLKMKIKRTKTGTTRNPEGKLEIVQSAGEGGEQQQINGASQCEGSSSPPPPPLSAEAVVNAVTAAAKQGVKGAIMNSSGKVVKLTGGGNSSCPPSKVNKSNGSNSKQTNGSTNGSSSSSNGSGVQDSGASYQTPPSAKKQKVDAGVCTEIATMTEPDALGPMDPGSSVTLEGIVWHETENGVLVINVTWRGKTYVGTLLDSTRHVNQWAPPRYSDSPTSELESRTPKGRGGKRGGRGAAGTPVETETRKNLRSSKGKSRQISFPSSSASSPAKDNKRKGRNDDDKSGSGSDSSDKKRPRTSSRNSPEDDEDSEKEKGNESDKEKGKDDESMTPKDTEDEKYVPPPPLPYSLTCPKPGCKKRYRHHNGLKFHVSFAHKELLNSHGEIRDMSEIERLEAEAKERLQQQQRRRREEVKEESCNSEDSCPSGLSSKNSTPGPAAESGNDVAAAMAAAAPMMPSSLLPQMPLAALSQLKPNFISSKLPGPPSDAKPIPVSAIDSVISSRPPMLGVPTIISSTSSSFKSSPKGVIRPPSNARPIVPATAPQLLTSGALGPSAINLKPIQPRPTIMADPTPNLSLEELRRKKEPKKKKENSPGTSPPRGPHNGNSPKANKPENGAAAVDKASEQQQQQAKSPAYSDISDDNDDSADRRVMTAERKAEANRLLPQQQPQQFGPPSFPFPYMLPQQQQQQSSPQLPTVPVSIKPSFESSPKPADKVGSGPQPGSLEYHKMLQAYGFPPLPYPIPPGVDPHLHIHLLSTDPGYKAKHDRERADKEKAFKEQIDRDNREKDRRAGVKQQHMDEDRVRTPEDLRKNSTPTLSVKSEFNVKAETKPEPVKDEGSKPTMETRGPPPGTNYGYIHPSLLRPGFPGLPYDLGVNHLLLGGGPGNPYNPYLPPHLQSLQQQRPPPFGNGDLLRSPFLPPSSLPEDLSRSAAAAAAAGMSTTKALDLLQQHASQFYNNHKIQELQERALKSPFGDKSSPKQQQQQPASSSSPNPGGRKGTPSPSLQQQQQASGNRSSPPPLRHVHTHTHTHFGLGYPLLPPNVPSLVPPAAHSPFSGAGFPNPLLPPKSVMPGFPPQK